MAYVRRFTYPPNALERPHRELGAGIDALGASLSARIDRLDTSLSARIDALTARVDGLNARLDQHIAGHRHAG